MTAIKPKMMKVMACPVCRGDIEHIIDAKGKEAMKCSLCGRSYELKEGMPVFL